MSEEPIKSPEGIRNSEQPVVEKLGQLGIDQETTSSNSPSIDFGTLAPAHPEGTERDNETLEDRCFRFVTQDIFSRLDQDEMFPDYEDSTRWADLHSATVLYVAAEDITINIHTRLLVKPYQGEVVDFASQGGSVTTLQYIADQQRNDPDALEGFVVKVDFFRGKYPPSGDSFDTGYESSFGMDSEEAAYRTDDPDEESVEQLGHFEMTTSPQEGSRLQLYLGSVEHPKKMSVSDIDTMTKWVRAAEELSPKE